MTDSMESAATGGDVWATGPWDFILYLARGDYHPQDEPERMLWEGKGWRTEECALAASGRAAEVDGYRPDRVTLEVAPAGVGPGAGETDLELAFRAAGAHSGDCECLAAGAMERKARPRSQPD